MAGGQRAAIPEDSAEPPYVGRSIVAGEWLDGHVPVHREWACCYDFLSGFDDARLRPVLSLIGSNRCQSGIVLVSVGRNAVPQAQV
jgi:hypothetical protein